MSSFTLLLILIAILLLLVGTAIFLYLVIRRSRKMEFASSAKAEPEKKEGSNVEFLQYASDVELRSSMLRSGRRVDWQCHQAHQRIRLEPA